MKLLFFLVVTLLAPLSALADDAPGGGGGGSEADHVSQFGVYFGRALPHGISSADDIFTLWGLRYSHPFGAAEKNGGGKFVDFAFIGGNGSNVHWGGLSVDASIQAPFETLIASVGLGVDFTQYSSDISTTKFVLGEHFLGSVMSRLGSSSFLRFDMKFNSQPGTTVFFGLGVVFDIGTPEGNAGG